MAFAWYSPRTDYAWPVMLQRMTWIQWLMAHANLADVDAAIVVLDANDLRLEEAEALQILVLYILLANAAW